MATIAPKRPDNSYDREDNDLISNENNQYVNPGQARNDEVTNLNNRYNQHSRKQSERNTNGNNRKDVEKNEQAGIQKKTDSSNAQGELISDSTSAFSYFKGSRGDKSGKKKKKTKGLKSKSKNAKIALTLAGLAGVIVGLLAGLAGIIGSYKIDFIMSNIDFKTNTRLNAYTDISANKYMKAYLQVRQAQPDGSVDENENAFFQALDQSGGGTPNTSVTGKYVTNKLFKNFYKAMLNSEKKIFSNDIIPKSGATTAGGSFSSTLTIDLDGPKDITTDGIDLSSGQGIDDYWDRTGANLDNSLFSPDRTESTSLRKKILNKVDLSDRLDRFRKRKAIQAFTKISDWSLFNRLRTSDPDIDNYQRSKARLSKRIFRSMFPDGIGLERMFGCLLGANKCPKSNPNHPDRQAFNASNLTGAGIDVANGNATDPNIDPNTQAELSALNNNESLPAGTVNEGLDAITDGPDVGNEVPALRRFLGTKLVSTGSNIIGVVRMVDSVHRALDGGENNPFLKSIAANKESQLVAFYTTHLIARDQIRSGGASPDELNAYSASFEYAQNSEVWQAVSTGEAVNVAEEKRKDYCSTKPDQRDKSEFALVCSELIPTFAALLNLALAYQESAIYPVFAQISNAVQDVYGSFIGRTLLAIENFIGDITTTLLTTALKITTGLDAEELTAQLIDYSFEQLGIGAFNPENVEQTINALGGGSQTTAELAAVTRGMPYLDTPAQQAFANDIALEYLEGERSIMSNFDRFASLSNHQSLLANFAFAASNSSLYSITSGLVSSLNPASVLTGYSKAASAQSNQFDLGLNSIFGLRQAGLVGDMLVDPYEINGPEDLTNADELFGIDVTYDLLSSHTALVAEIAEKVGDDPEGLALIDKVYNEYENGKQMMCSIAGSSGLTCSDELRGSDIYTESVNQAAVSGGVSGGGANPKYLAGGSFNVPEITEAKRDASQCTVTISPGQNIQSAISSGGPGTVICIRSGVYNESLYVGASGSSGNELVITGYPGDTKPQIIPPYGACGIVIKSAYVEVSNLEFDGKSTTGGTAIRPPEGKCGYGIVFDTAHHVYIYNNVVHNNPGGGITGIYSNHAKIEGNLVYENAYWLTNQTSGISLASSSNSIGGANNGFDGYSVLIRYNIVFANENLVAEDYGGAPNPRITDGNCIINDYNHITGYNGRWLVEQNVCFNNGAKGVQFYKSGYGDVRNNTMYHNARTGWMNTLGLGIAPGPVEIAVAEIDNASVNFENNLMWAHPGSTVYGGYQSSGVNFTGNVCVDKSGTSCNTTVTGNPGFVNPTIDSNAADFRIVPGSQLDQLGVGATAWRADATTLVNVTSPTPSTVANTNAPVVFGYDESYRFVEADDESTNIDSANSNIFSLSGLKESLWKF